MMSVGEASKSRLLAFSIGYFQVHLYRFYRCIYLNNSIKKSYYSYYFIYSLSTYMVAPPKETMFQKTMYSSIYSVLCNRWPLDFGNLFKDV